MPPYFLQSEIHWSNKHKNNYDAENIDLLYSKDQKGSFEDSRVDKSHYLSIKNEFFQKNTLIFIINAFSIRKTCITASISLTFPDYELRQAIRTVSRKQRDNGGKLYNRLSRQPSHLVELKHFLPGADKRWQLWKGAAGGSIKWE
jgi:hypothetical protein